MGRYYIGLLQYIGGTPITIEFFSMFYINVVPQVLSTSKNLFKLVTFGAFVAWSCRRSNIGIFNIYGGGARNTREGSLQCIELFFIHVFPRVGLMSEDLLTLVAFVAWAVWEKQYWPIGGSPDQGNYLKAYSHGPGLEKSNKYSFGHNLKPGYFLLLEFLGIFYPPLFY